MFIKKRLFGSLLVMLSLSTGQALAGGMEPDPGGEMEPVDVKDGELASVRVAEAFADPDPKLEEEPGEDGFIPEAPILLDGKLYSPKELSDAGVHLAHYVLDERSAEMGVVQGFRSADELQNYLEKTGKMPSDEPTEAKALCNPFSYFYDGILYSGPYFTVYPGMGYPWLGSFDNRITSVRSTQCGRWTLLTSLPQFQGRKLWLYRNWAVPYLGFYGYITFSWPFFTWNSWNNRASSVAVFW